MNQAIISVSKRNYISILSNILAIALVASIPLANSVTTIVSLLLVVTCIYYMDKETWSQVLRNPTVISILLYISICLICTTYSIGNNKDIALSIRKASRLIYFLFLIPIFAKENVRWYAYNAFMGAICISVLVSAIYGWPFFKDPIFTSLFVAYAIFMLAHLSICQKKYRTQCIIIAVAMCYYLFFLNTGRAGQLLFFALSTLFIWQRIKITRRTSLVLITLFSIFLGSMALLPNRFVSRQTIALREVKEYIQSSPEAISHESSLGIRLMLVQNSLELIKLKPLFGFGSGSFHNAYGNVVPDSLKGKVEGTNPHNQYLLTWVELGLPGLILLLAIFATLFMQFVKHSSLENHLGMGLLLCMMIGCTMNSWLLDYTSCIFFVTMAAVCVGYNFSIKTR